MKTKIRNIELCRHKCFYGTVALKSRKNGNNPASLYLEIYVKSIQKRHLQFLNLYFTGNETFDTAIKKEAINRCIGYDFNVKEFSEVSFTDFFKEEINKIIKEQSRKNLRSALKKLQEFASIENIPFKRIDERFLIGFREWLLTKAISETDKRILDKNTSHNYLSAVMRFANRAQRKSLIAANAYIAGDIPPIGNDIKVPVTFTEEEIKKLQSNLYPATPEICKALMLQFTCGQRWGDVRDMNWEQIVPEEEVYKIVLKQEKTDKVLPSFITKALIDWIGQGKERKGKIFTDIPKDDQTVREHLQRWCNKAGIEKKVGTHTMRRSCATILYKKGVPLFTISKILGHSSADITLRYIGIDEKDIRKGLEVLNEITSSFSYSVAS